MNRPEYVRWRWKRQISEGGRFQKAGVVPFISAPRQSRIGELIVGSTIKIAQDLARAKFVKHDAMLICNLNNYTKRGIK